MKYASILLLSFTAFSSFANDNYDRGAKAYSEGQYTVALTHIAKAAEQGYPKAQNHLGVMYDDGNGVNEDDKKAVIWYRKAAEQGYAKAQANLAYMYSNGSGVDKDEKQAVTWYRKAAEQGHVDAQRNLAVMYFKGIVVNKDEKQAAFWFLKAAEQGDAFAQRNLAVMYSEGKGVGKDKKQAASWYLKAAEQGDANAQYRLGVIYEHGHGVNKDYKQAVSWYRKAAEQGFDWAQYAIGNMYYSGRGIPTDMVQAAAWYQKASDQEHRAANGRLAVMFRTGTGVSKDESMALALYKKSNSRREYTEYKKLLDCQKSSKTKLFDRFLNCTKKSDLTSSIRSAGATWKGKGDQPLRIIYNSQSVLKGSSELVIDYASSGYISEARYTFPNNMDTSKVLDVRNFVANKYGEPNYASGNIDVGDVVFKWNLEDGIELTVFRGWPDTTVYLSFVNPENYKARIEELEKLRKEREAKHYNAQDNAF